MRQRLCASVYIWETWLGFHLNDNISKQLGSAYFGQICFTFYHISSLLSLFEAGLFYTWENWYLAMLNSSSIQQLFSGPGMVLGARDIPMN